MKHVSIERHKPADQSLLGGVSEPALTIPAELLPCPTAPYYAAPAAPEIPSAVGGLIAASYLTLIGALAIATTRSPLSIFAIVIAAFFVAMFFAVPRIFFGIEPKMGRRPAMAQFMHEGLATHTGHSSGRATLVQMLVVPVCLTIGVMAMGVIVAMNF